MCKYFKIRKLYIDLLMILQIFFIKLNEHAITAYRKTGTRDPSGTLQKLENQDPSGTLQKPKNRDPSGTLQKLGNRDPSGTLQKPENQDPRT